MVMWSQSLKAKRAILKQPFSLVLSINVEAISCKMTIDSLKWIKIIQNYIFLWATITATWSPATRTSNSSILFLSLLSQIVAVNMLRISYMLISLI